MAYYEGEIGPIGNYGNGGNGWGGNDAWWIIILLIFGYGNNGFGNGGRTGSEVLGYELGKVATTNDVASGFNNSAVLGSLNDLKLGQSQGFASVQQTLCQGFGGVNATVNQVGNTINQGICNLGYSLQNGLNGISREIGDCCCITQRAIEGINYNMAKNTCDIIQNQTANTQRIIDFLTNEKICSLQADNAALTAQLSQNAQTSAIVNALAPKQPVPAYPVFPATSFAHPTGVTFGVGNNCGCGCNGIQ